jgi:hypothetical protein
MAFFQTACPLCTGAWDSGTVGSLEACIFEIIALNKSIKVPQVIYRHFNEYNFLQRHSALTRVDACTKFLLKVFNPSIYMVSRKKLIPSRLIWITKVSVFFTHPVYAGLPWHFTFSNKGLLTESEVCTGKYLPEVFVQINTFRTRQILSRTDRACKTTKRG